MDGFWELDKLDGASNWNYWNILKLGYSRDSTGFQGRINCHALQFGPGHVPRHFRTVAEGTVWHGAMAEWQIEQLRQPWRPCTLWMKWTAHSLPGSKEHWAVHWTQRIHEPVSQAKDTNLSLTVLKPAKHCQILFQKSWDALWSHFMPRFANMWGWVKTYYYQF